MKTTRRPKQKLSSTTERNDKAKEIRPNPISVSIERDELVLRMPLHEPVPSKSGKTMVVASTMGALPTGLSLAGAHVILNANAYIKPGEPEWGQAAQATMARLVGRLK
jgi:hypothetical protein